MEETSLHDASSGALHKRIQELESEIAALKKERIEISKAKELYLKIFEDFPALIWRSRLDKLCDYFNTTWLEFTGRTMEQEFGNGWAEGVHPDDFDSCLQTYVAAFDKREPFLMEYRLKDRFGEYRWIRDFGRPFFDLDNSFLGYIGSCYDVTEIKEKEMRLVELNATKDKLFSIIAHDLRAPFNSIVGFSEILVEEAGDDDRIAPLADAILNSSHQVMKLLTNLIAWSMAQSGRMEFKPESLLLSSHVDDVLELLAGAAAQKSITLQHSIPVEQKVYADAEMLATILRNLISNAIKYTNTQGRITIECVETTAGMLTLRVIDNGIGISDERVDTIFNTANNHSTPGTQDEKGTGLGLILCKEFVDRHHGCISAESAIGVGTTISFSMPTTADSFAHAKSRGSLKNVCSDGALI